MTPSTLVRWCKFNLVGGIGIGVQFAALFLLKTVLHFHYLGATAIAVEAAVVHNFVWHEQFTWVDRTKSDRVQPSWRTAISPTSAAERLAEKPDFGWRSAFSAAISPCFSVRASAPEVPGFSASCVAQNRGGSLFAALKRCATQRLHGASFRRFLRFHLSNGAVSILGNLALMKVMVGQGHMNYLVANAVAIALCSLANFLVSEEWVFEE